MKSKPKQSYQPKLMPTEKQFEAMCRRVEETLLRQGAKPSEVALLRNVAGNALASAVVIGLIKEQNETKDRNLMNSPVGTGTNSFCTEDDGPIF